MKGDNLVYGLIRKRREIGRSIAAYHAEIERLRLDMAALDHVLVIWRPEIDLASITAYATDNRGVRPGEIARPLLAALRMSSEPLGITELARYLIAVRGDTTEPMELYRKRVRRSLDKLKARGFVTSQPNSGRLLWQIVR